MLRDLALKDQGFQVWDLANEHCLLERSSEYEFDICEAELTIDFEIRFLLSEDFHAFLDAQGCPVPLAQSSDQKSNLKEIP